MTITINPFPKQPDDYGNPRLPSKLFTATGTGTGKGPGERMRNITFTLTAEDDSEVDMDDSHIHCEHWKDKDDIEHLIWTTVFEKVAEGNDYTLTVTNADDDEDVS